MDILEEYFIWKYNDLVLYDKCNEEKSNHPS